MRLFLDIMQGMGLSAAAGMRPFLPALLAGALARSQVGLNFAGTDYQFLQDQGFLLALVVATILTVFVQRRFGPMAVQTGPYGATLGGIGLGLGALLFAGSLADHGYTAWPGLAGGMLCAGIAQTAARATFIRAAARLDAGTRQALPFYFEAVAFVLAALAIFLSPISIGVVIFFLLLIFAGRRRAEQKYAGLRSLR